MITQEEMIKDIKEMLIVLRALTPKETDGEIVLNRWINKYKNLICSSKKVSQSVCQKCWKIGQIQNDCPDCNGTGLHSLKAR